MIWGVFPEDFFPNVFKEDSNPISWESHLSGFLVGLLFAFISRKYGEKPKKYSWEVNAEPDAREKWLWEKYKESLSDEERKDLEVKYGEWVEPQEPSNLDSKDDQSNPPHDNQGGYWYQNHS